MRKLPLFLTMRFYFPLIFLLLPLTTLAQTGVIKGKVQRMDSKAAMGQASVFLSNSSYGTITDDDGSFTLSGVKPGQYQLVVTSVGFEDFNQTILVGKDDVKIFAELIPKSTQLHEVVITTPANWKKNYDMFVKAFLGESENAKKCRIANPHVLSFNYHKAQKKLDAWSDEFIEIDNRAIGYKVKFLLKSFELDDINNLISWEGKILYTELPGTAAQKKAWEAKRNNIYYGSSRHFFRSLKDAKISEDGFLVMTLIRKPNPARPRQDIIVKKIDQFVKENKVDSVNRWKNLYNLPKYDETLVRAPLKETDFARATDQEGLFAITFPQNLYVMYTKKREETDFKDIYHPLDMPNYQTSVITLYKPYALFDMNGTLITGLDALIEGTWSKSKVPEMLPVDYVPGDMVIKDTF